MGVWWDSRPNEARQEWSREPGESSSCSHKRGSPGRAVAFARGQPSCPVCIYIYTCQPQTIKASNKNPPSLTKGSGEGHPNKTTTFRQEPGQPNKRPYPSRASEGRTSSLGGPSQKSRTRCSNHHSFQPGWWEKKKMYGTQSVAESTVLSEPTNKSRKCLHHFGVTGLK